MTLGSPSRRFVRIQARGLTGIRRTGTDAEEPRDVRCWRREPGITRTGLSTRPAASRPTNRTASPERSKPVAMVVDRVSD